MCRRGRALPAIGVIRQTVSLGPRRMSARSRKDLLDVLKPMSRSTENLLWQYHSYSNARRAAGDMASSGCWESINVRLPLAPSAFRTRSKDVLSLVLFNMKCVPYESHTDAEGAGRSTTALHRGGCCLYRSALDVC
jgi:hypothetical protein